MAWWIITSRLIQGDMTGTCHDSCYRSTGLGPGCSGRWPVVRSLMPSHPKLMILRPHWVFSMDSGQLQILRFRKAFSKMNVLRSTSSSLFAKVDLNKDRRICGMGILSMILLAGIEDMGQGNGTREQKVLQKVPYSQISSAIVDLE